MSHASVGAAPGPADVLPVRRRRYLVIACIALGAISLSLVLWAAGSPLRPWPLYAALLVGGVPLVIELAVKLFKGDFGSDLLAAVSIVTAVLLGEYLAGTLVVLMLSGGQAIETYAMGRASSALEALAKRMPSVAHRRSGDVLEDVPIDQIAVDDLVVVLPHEASPVDGVVVEGRSVMDESYLTGEPYEMSKAPGSAVLSGAINGENALTIRAQRSAQDSRYAQIMAVMRASQQQRPHMRRLADRLGAWYTPLAIVIALAAWGISGDPTRFLAVLVVATPCPLLIAIPVAIIGAVSLAARRSIIIRDPLVLERIGTCRTMILDKTGTLTFGRPSLVIQHIRPGGDADHTLALAASLERYSKHPLAAAVVKAAEASNISLLPVSEISEPPGLGLRGVVEGHQVTVTSRKVVLANDPQSADLLPPLAGGLECVVLVDGAIAATYQFRDAPRPDGSAFVTHLDKHHHIDRVMLVSGDRANEVEYLAKEVGIELVLAGQTPEQKVAITREETQSAPTIFVGDGINDAPALLAATVGVAMGVASDVTTQAAGAVILDSSLRRVDELMHIGSRMRTIALQSALGGMALSIVGMILASMGYLPPVAGALAQEAIDVLAIFNALRAAFPSKSLSDM
ncbi:MAG: heavy metal translocating P-type ATPase [Phycisphaeraceae bacterium]|nr:heavy metal translocating P-type ATPase [Phycisphaeraceae bacterium]